MLFKIIAKNTNKTSNTGVKKMVANNLRFVDGAIVIVLLLSSALISYTVGRRQKTKEAYLVAGRKMHWFPISLSAVAGAFSAVSLLGTPGYVIAADMRYVPMLFMGIISIPMVYFVVIPTCTALFIQTEQCGN